MSPAMPKAPTEVERLAAPDGLAEGLADALLAGVEVPEAPPELAAPDEAAGEAPELVGPAAPPTEIAVVTQLESGLGRIFNGDEKAVAPVLSLIARVIWTLAWMSTTQVVLVPGCVGNCLMGAAEGCCPGRMDRKKGGVPSLHVSWVG